MQEIHSTVANRVCKSGVESQSGGETAKPASHVNWKHTKCTKQVNNTSKHIKKYTPVLHSVQYRHYF